MEFLSVTNKKTHLHKSPADLSILATYEHDKKGSVSTDISLFRSELMPNSFAQIYKTDIVEIFHVKKADSGSDNPFEICKTHKINRPGVQAVAGGTDCDFAAGTLTGESYHFNVKTKSLKKFSGVPAKASSVSVDINCDGTYLGSLNENGVLFIFNLEKSIKSSSLKFPEAISARFHPTRRNFIAGSTFKGSVTIFDFVSVKKVFEEKNAHDAPCREIAIPEHNPDRLFTCGCDSFIKIFDVRKKSAGLQIQSHCGFSTISVTSCGGFFVVGNLKGDLMTYDMRDLKKPLAMTKGDGELITRVAFMPKLGYSGSYEPSMHDISAELPEPPEVQEEFNLDQIWEATNKNRPSDFDISCSSRVSAMYGKVNEDRRGSALFGQNLANAFNLSINLDDDSSSQSPAPVATKRDSSMRRRSSFKPSPMQLIQEEHSDKENHSGSLNTPNAMSSSGPRFSSTPATVVRFNLKDKLEVPPQEHLESSEEVIDVDALDSFNSKEKSDNQETVTTVTTAPSAGGIDIKKEFEAIRESMRFEVQSLSFDLSGRHIEAMTYIFNQRRAIDKRLERIEECMGLLMNDDVKIARVMELMDENTRLKNQLASTMSQMNSMSQNKGSEIEEKL